MTLIDTVTYRVHDGGKKNFMTGGENTGRCADQSQTGGDLSKETRAALGSFLKEPDKINSVGH